MIDDTLPETVLQFGSGKFLRAFADLFIHQANQVGQEVGRVVVVQSTGNERAELLNRQRGHYHVVIRGLENGQLIDRVEESRSISRALVAATQWDEILRVARSPELKFVLSNTSEAGYDLDAADMPDSTPPHSFPTKLLRVLWERFHAGRNGLVIIPCELHDGNADLLLSLLDQLVTSWKLTKDFRQWLHRECVWLNTLVDRIVTGRPADHPLLKTDLLLTLAEPYALWAIQEKSGGDFFRHEVIRRAADIQPFFLRKVRILNAAHTAMVGIARQRGIATVGEALGDSVISAWVSRLLFEEIVPVLEGRVEDPAGFARQTLERFQNPFLDHKFADIAVYHDAKVRIRLLPTRTEYIEKFGRPPVLLDQAIAENSRYVCE